MTEPMLIRPTTAAGHDKYVGVKEVADFLGVPVSWVREHTRTGGIPHRKMGRYVRYVLDEVVEWVDSQKRGGEPWRKHLPSTEGRKPR